MEQCVIPAPTVFAYCVARQAYQNPVSQCDSIRCAMSDGTIQEMARHPSEHWAYTDYFKNAQVLSPLEFQKLYCTNNT